MKTRIIEEIYKFPDGETVKRYYPQYKKLFWWVTLTPTLREHFFVSHALPLGLDDAQGVLEKFKRQRHLRWYYNNATISTSVKEESCE